MTYRFVARFMAHPAPLPGVHIAHPRAFQVDELVERTRAVVTDKGATVFFHASDGPEFMADLEAFEGAAVPN